jgi:hypothetical protein
LNWFYTFHGASADRHLVVKLLCLDPGMVEPDVLQGLLGQIQLNFLVSHEYAHHIHRHWVERQSGGIGVWTEFPHDATCGSINSQAQELDADGYAAYLVLAHLLRGGGDGDELLLTCFFLAVLAFFCEFWHGDIDMAGISVQASSSASQDQIYDPGC